MNDSLMMEKKRNSAVNKKSINIKDARVQTRFVQTFTSESVNQWRMKNKEYLDYELAQEIGMNETSNSSSSQQSDIESDDMLQEIQEEQEEKSIDSNSK